MLLHTNSCNCGHAPIVAAFLYLVFLGGLLACSRAQGFACIWCMSEIFYTARCCRSLARASLALWECTQIRCSSPSNLTAAACNPCVCFLSKVLGAASRQSPFHQLAGIPLSVRSVDWDDAKHQCIVHSFFSASSRFTSACLARHGHLNAQSAISMLCLVRSILPDVLASQVTAFYGCRMQ